MDLPADGCATRVGRLSVLLAGIETLVHRRGLHQVHVGFPAQRLGYTLDGCVFHRRASQPRVTCNKRPERFKHSDGQSTRCGHNQQLTRT